MKILYGVSGEGLGHSSRAREVIPFLEKKGHEVLVVTYGQAYEVLRREFNCFKVEGVMPRYIGGRMDLRGSFEQGFETIWKNLKNADKIKKKVERFRPELCITDMEPIVPIIRFYYKLPLISFDNQHRLLFLDYKTPARYLGEKEVARRAVEGRVSRADAFVIVSFSKGKMRKTGKKVYVVDPLIRKEVRDVKPRKGNKIVVYLSREVKRVTEVLKEFKDERFVVYGRHAEKREGNVEFKKISDKFVGDLAGAKAVIGTAGFSLIVESLYLKKPFFAIPLKGQFEQAFNSLLLKQEGFGDYSEKLEKKDVARFLRNLKRYEKKLGKKEIESDEALEVLDRLVWLIGKQQLY